MEMLPMRDGRTDERRRTREDSATQPMDAGWLSFAIYWTIGQINFHFLTNMFYNCLVGNPSTWLTRPPTALPCSNTLAIWTNTSDHQHKYIYFLSSTFFKIVTRFRLPYFLTYLIHSSTFRALWGKENIEFWTCSGCVFQLYHCR